LNKLEENVESRPMHPIKMKNTKETETNSLSLCVGEVATFLVYPTHTFEYISG